MPYKNNSEKGLGKNMKNRHNITQTDGADGEDLVVFRNWKKESHEHVNLLSEVLLEPPTKVFCRVKGISVYNFTYSHV